MTFVFPLAIIYCLMFLFSFVMWEKDSWYFKTTTKHQGSRSKSVTRQSYWKAWLFINPERSAISAHKETRTLEETVLGVTERGSVSLKQKNGVCLGIQSQRPKQCISLSWSDEAKPHAGVKNRLVIDTMTRDFSHVTEKNKPSVMIGISETQTK